MRGEHLRAQSAVPAAKSAHRGSQSAAPATKSANEPLVQKSRFTAPVTKSERREDHRHVQSAEPATKSALRSAAAPIPLICHEKSTLDSQSTRFPLHLPQNHVQKCARRHNESAVATSTRRGPPDFATLRIRNAHRGFRET